MTAWRARRERIGEPMVRWFSPAGLLYSGINVLLSGLFSRFADKRGLVASIPAVPIRFTKLDETIATGREDIWIDYVADTGDGWGPTSAIAWAACRELPVEGEVTKPGRLLVLGGDEVYPSADYKQYQTRLVEPFAVAAAQLPPGPRDVLAIPGNHDWLDGLTAFMRVFSEGESVAVWRARQKRSYFAAQLRTNWWLLGVDIGFDSYLDAGQLRFFEECRGVDAFSIGPGDHIILCTGKPTWAERSLAGDARIRHHARRSTLLAEFERRVVSEWGCDLALVISGDLHHYARYSVDDGARQRVTAGGGGAFLFPTYGLAPDVDDWPDPSGVGTETAHLEAAYPDPDTSRSYRWRVDYGPISTWTFLLLVGGIHLAIASQVRGAVHTGKTSTLHALADVPYLDLLGSIFTRPLSGLIAVLLLLGLCAFFDASGSINRLIVGGVHWLAQIGAVAGSMWIAGHSTMALLDLPDGGSASLPVTILAYVSMGALTAGLGAVFGAFVFGWYLTLCVAMGRHANDAFAGIHLETHKSFVRLKLGADGGLTLYPFMVPRPPDRPRKLTFEEQGAHPTFDGLVVWPIEPPVSIRPAGKA
jgi:hypothetical protein